MSCEARRDLWMLYAAGELEPGEAGELLQHLESGCAGCAAARAEAEAVIGLLPLALPALAPPPQLRERLLQRVAAAPRTEFEERAASAPRRSNVGWFRGGFIAAAAAVVVLALLAALLGQRLSEMEGQVTAQQRRIGELEAGERQLSELQTTVESQARELRRLRATETESASQIDGRSEEIDRLEGSLAELNRTLAEREAEIRRLQAALDDRETRIAAYRSTDVRVFTMAGTENARNASARVFWNTRKSSWDFYVSGMRPAGLAKTYQLWFITADQRKISAGTFDVDERGEAVLLNIRVPRDAGLIEATAVTDEPVGGSLQPGGRFQLLATVPLSST